MLDLRTVIVTVALPEGTPATWLRVAELAAWHGWAASVPSPVFPIRRRPVSSWLTRWSSRHLLEATRRHGAVSQATGGRISRLDLNQLGWRTRQEATDRWWTWHHQAAGRTSIARTWDDFLAQHHHEPHKLSLDEARTRFEAQPRVLAMLAYNTYPTARHELPVQELAAFQAGEAVYVTLHWHRALSGDALITPNGHVLQPSSPSLADTLRYHADAARVVANLAPTQHLVAVKAAPAP